MTTPSRGRRANRVQSSGRPSGAPSELDAAETLWDLPGHRAIPLSQPKSQTRNYNLISAISGPTVGVHFTDSTGRRRSRSSAAEREEWIQAWKASGQTQAAFAMEQGLRLSTLRNRLRRRRRPVEHPVPLREVSLAEVLSPGCGGRGGDWEFEIRLPGGAVVSVLRGTPASRVRVDRRPLGHDSRLATLLKWLILLRRKAFLLSKQKTISTEAQLRQAAKEALEADALLRWRWRGFELKRERGANAVLELNVDGRRLVFQVEFKLTPSAREVERLAERGGARPGLLIAPSLSEVLVEHCRERGLSCVDLNGRQWIRAQGVLVDRKPSQERRFRPPVLPPDAFQPKSSRLVRALLSQPTRTWSQGELGERTGLSPGLVSRLVRHLVNEGFVAQDKRALRLNRADALLDAWAARDDWGKRTTVRQYSLLESDAGTVARKLVKVFPAGETLVFTQWFAANLRHPYTIPPLVSAYVARFPTEQTERELRARQVADGGTLWLVAPKDDGIFRETQRVGDFTLACDAQIYLDLLHAGLRGPEQAKALREWEDFSRVEA